MDLKFTSHGSRCGGKYLHGSWWKFPWKQMDISTLCGGRGSSDYTCLDGIGVAGGSPADFRRLLCTLWVEAGYQMGPDTGRVSFGWDRVNEGRKQMDLS